GTTSSRGHGRAKKLGPQARVPIGKNITPQIEAHPCAIPKEAPEASNQASVSASSEWQRKLEAAEALLTLRESSAPPGSISLLQPCVAPAPDGDKGLQPSSPSLWPRPASSISLPIGHLGCISLLN
uniref:Doublesex- and mab-3-related transcription factor C1/C2 C-terminal domain-containing protein n=1 Tax=Moschus moschiferus TaxID=68415 RepID=A0A8C6CT41_MOSMO